MNRDGHTQSILLNTHMHSLSRVSNQASHYAYLLPSLPPFAFAFATFSLTKSIVSSSTPQAPLYPLNSLNSSLQFQHMARVAQAPPLAATNDGPETCFSLSNLLPFSPVDSPFLQSRVVFDTI